MDSFPSPLPPSDPHGHDATPANADADAGLEDYPVAAPVDDLRRRWKGKDRATEEVPPELSTPSDPPGTREPLTLLKLPVDILRLILHEVSHPNEADLLPLLLVNSTMHDITVPYIYSSFDIIWPEEGTYLHRVSDTDVDALTYGLTSLALGSRFARTMHRLQGIPPPKKQGSNARFIKSFRISNGLPKWVTYYSVTSEAGMMLNSLVAMALPKMTNLESFIWDMPTGLSSNVFLALSCLEEDNPGILNEVWIRWHEAPPSTSSSSSSPIFHNVPGPVPQPHVAAVTTASPPSPPSSNPESLGSPTPFHLMNPYRRVPYREADVEFPTYSILPALRSIAALDVNELAYLDELAVLVERSKLVLRELRISIATKAAEDEFTRIKGDSRGLRQYDPDARWPGESRIGDRRLGGVLGIVLARVYDIRRNHSRSKTGETEPGVTEASHSKKETPEATTARIDPDNELGSGLSDPAAVAPSTEAKMNSSVRQGTPPFVDSSAERSINKENHTDFKLALESLELARVPLHTAIAADAIDWTLLTTLTILSCDRSDRLWRLLRDRFRVSPPSARPSRHDSAGRQLKEPPTYQLKLKNIHVDITTFAFLLFIKDTLAPNSLEVLFLHDRRPTHRPTVPILDVYNKAVKRHFSSLKKLLLDSSHPDRISHHNDIRRMSWALPSDIVLEATSGSMPALKELSLCVHPKDWHTILQRLPNMRSLTALHVSSLGREFASLESAQFAQQIVDVITLRPEIQLCFLAIRGNCFEIVESTHGSADSDGGIWMSSSSSVSGSSDIHQSDDESSNDDLLLAEDSDDASQSSRRLAPGSSSWPERMASNKTYRLRRVAFSDEDVAIFKARHGAL